VRPLCRLQASPTGPIAALGADRVPERAALIAAQLLGVALCRYILRFEPRASLPADDVVAAVGPSVHQYLTRASWRGTPGRDG
jgi:Tetracyclin repressor-like, C-terminal domain